MSKEITLLLPTTGEPLLLYCWFQNFKKYQHLISNIFVAVDTMGRLNPMEFIFLQNYLKRQFSKVPNLRYHYNSAIGQHGLNIDTLFKNYEADIKENVLLMEEDDLIINTKLLENEVNNFFENQYNIIGVGRGSCHALIAKLVADYVKNKKDLVVETALGDHEHFYNLWPTLFLTKKKYFLNSSRTFESYSWLKDTVFKMGDSEHLLPEDCHGDTFVKFSTELYQNIEIKKVKLLSNTYHSLLEDNVIIPRIIDSSIDFHIGSLSGVLPNKLWVPLKDGEYHSFVEYMRAIKDRENSHHEIVNVYRRCCLLRCMLTSIKNPQDFEFYKTYETNINLIIKTFEDENNMSELFDKFNVGSIKSCVIGENHTAIFNKIYEQS